MDKVKFDTKLFPGEDPKFIADAKKAKFKVAYSPNIRIYHRRRPTVRKLVKQIFNYGKVRPQKESFMETLKNPFFLIPSIFTLYLATLILSTLANPSITGNVIGIGKESSLFSLFFSLPIMCYIFLSLLFSLFGSIKNRSLKAIFVLPFIYLLIHLSYGAGMIYGYLRANP